MKSLLYIFLCFLSLQGLAQPSTTFTLKPTEVAHFYLYRNAANTHRVIITNTTTQVTIVDEHNPTGHRLSQVNTTLADQTISVVAHGCTRMRQDGSATNFNLRFEDAGDNDFNDCVINVVISRIDDPAKFMKLANLLLSINERSSLSVPRQEMSNATILENIKSDTDNQYLKANSSIALPKSTYNLSRETQQAYTQLMAEVEQFQRLTTILISFAVWQKLFKPEIDTIIEITTEDWSAYSRAIIDLNIIAQRRICNDAILYATIDDQVSKTPDDRKFWENIARIHCP